MDVAYDLDIDSVPLPIEAGISAYDPLTMKLAAQKLAERVPVSAWEGLDHPIPPVLEELAVIEEHPELPIIVAVIDTGLLKWHEDLRFIVKNLEFSTYKNEERKGVYLGDGDVYHAEDADIFTAPMVTEDGKELELWVAQLRSEFPGMVDGLALVESAKKWRQAYLDNPLEQTYYDEVVIPAQKLEYSTYSGGVEAPQTAFRQKFKATLDEKGARVVAATIAIIGAAPVETTEIHLGSKGPVVFWLAQKGYEQPFAVIYTESPAWPEWEEEIDHDFEFEALSEEELAALGIEIVDSDNPPDIKSAFLL